MNLLLDTHIWTRRALTPEKLPPPVRERLTAKDTQLWLSPISAWEALMLIERGRLSVRGDGPAWVDNAWKAGPFREAALTYDVAAASRRLVVPVQDPADRFLVATALVYGCTFATADHQLRAVHEIEIL